jgi:acyl dehydratase
VSAFEVLAIGDTAEFGSYEFTAERIKRFAEAWDPQPFHVDEAAAEKSAFGGLVASGWHTCSAMMRLQIDYFAEPGRPRPSFRISPGFEDLKWLKPVFAGDRVTYSGRVIAKRLSRSRPGMGIVTSEIAGVNQNGERVFTVNAHIFMSVD